MSPERVTEITAERLSRWGNYLAAKHATPLLVLGMGHDERRGTVEVCIPADVPLPDVLVAIRAALRILERQGDGK